MVQLHVELDVQQAFSDKLDDTWIDRLHAVMDQDFNTANVLSDLYAIMKLINASVRANDSLVMATLYNTVLEYSTILGLRFDLPRLSAKDRLLYSDWLDARENKDFERADTLRSVLMERGILMWMPYKWRIWAIVF